MAIPAFGWNNNQAPALNATNLEAEHAAAGAYTDQQIATEAATRNTAITSSVANETSRATAAEALLAPLASASLTGSPTAPTPSIGDNTGRLATTAFVTTAVSAGGGGGGSVNIDGGNATSTYAANIDGGAAS